MPQPVELMDAASLVSLATLCALGLWKLVRMDGMLELRAAVLSALLWAAAFYLLMLALPNYNSACVIAFD